MAESERRGELNINEVIEGDALALGCKVLGRDLTPEEADALRTIFQATAQALAHGFIQRLADHVLAERRDETLEEFFEGKVKTD
jgi:hypothetical protein